MVPSLPSSENTSSSSDPNPYNQSGFAQIEEDIRFKAGQILFGLRHAKMQPVWLEQAPTEWIMQIMMSLRKSATNLSDYEEFRGGLMEAAALCLVQINFADQLQRCKVEEEQKEKDGN